MKLHWMSALGIAALAACGGHTHDRHAAHHATHHSAHHQPAAHAGHHAPAPQGVNSVDVYRDGNTLHLLTGELRGEAQSLWYARSDDAGATWTAKLRVDTAGTAPRPAPRGDDAQVAARGDTVLALWSIPGTGYGGSGPFQGAISRDGGKTWSAAGQPSDSGMTTGHGYADLLADAEGFHAVWLDGRDKTQGLRYAASRDGMKWARNETLVSGSCECCWNSLLRQEDKLHVLFRARDPRDMELATLRGGAWTRGGSVGGFGWRIKGCPETGGGLAATADGALHAMVWTGIEGGTGVYAVRSSGAGWATPHKLGGSDAQHGDIAAAGATLAAAWDEKDAIYGAISRDGGTTWRAAERLSSGRGAASHPKVLATGGGFIVLWTEAEAAGPRVLATRFIK